MIINKTKALRLNACVDWKTCFSLPTFFSFLDTIGTYGCSFTSRTIQTGQRNFPGQQK